jgi:hypothetical protein
MKPADDGNDDRLSARLAEWQAPEPRAGFEDAVWRRIRAEPVRRRFLPWPVPHFGLPEHPAWTSAAAAAAGIAAGLALALLPPARPEGRPHDALLHPRTLAGSYVAMMTEGTP